MTPETPWYPQVPPLGHDPGDQMKIPSDMFYIIFSFLRRHTKFGLKIFEIDFVVEIKLFNLLAPPQGPRGQGPKSGWFSGKKIGPPTPPPPHGTPKSRPLGMAQAAE